VKLPLFLLALAALAPAATVTTLIGDGTPGFSDTQVNNPYGLVIGPDGALYFCDLDNQRIRRLDLKTKGLTTIAGDGQKGYRGDGGPAIQASLNMPHELRFDRDGDIYIAERDNHVIRKVDTKTGIISTFAGTGKAGFSGDGGPASSAQLNQPHSIYFDRDGSLLICDIMNNRIRRVLHGIIDTWNVTGAALRGPRTIAIGPSGDLYVALREGNAIYSIDAQTHALHHIGGTGVQGHSGDGGPAQQATLAGPKGLDLDPVGILYLADTESHTIRSVDLKTGTISTVLDNLKRPHGVYFRDGTLYVSDSENHRILSVSK
jgi:DNA-binding beta-propeller fold protein YncE